VITRIALNSIEPKKKDRQILAALLFSDYALVDLISRAD